MNINNTYPTAQSSHTYMFTYLEVLVVYAGQVDFRIVEDHLRRNVHIVESLETFTLNLYYLCIHTYIHTYKLYVAYLITLNTLPYTQHVYIPT